MKESLSFHGLERSLNSSYHRFLDSQMHPESPVPITALGAAGAAIGLVPHMAEAGTVLANDVAVFTAMCMCWSGYLSTHVAMMSSLKVNKLTGKAILSTRSVDSAPGRRNWIFKLVMLFL